MTQTESLEKFGRAQAAWASAVVATGPHHKPSLGTEMQTSGTVFGVELPETEDLTVYYPPGILRAAEDEIDITVTLSAAHYPAQTIAFGQPHTWNILRVDNDSDVEPIEIGGASADSDLSDDLHDIVDLARRSGLHDVAERLTQLSKQPHDDDERPLLGRTAAPFVHYCLARGKATRPLMTVTPTGELDVTWKDAAGEKVLMRFFEDGRVWVAYRLSKERGSFEVAARDLVRQSLHFKLPTWA